MEDGLIYASADGPNDLASMDMGFISQPPAIGQFKSRREKKKFRPLVKTFVVDSSAVVS